MSPDGDNAVNPCPDARRAAFALAVSSPRSPGPYETSTDEELLPLVMQRVPTASREECLEALATVRGLCNAVYDTCNEYRAGRFGTGAAANARAANHLSKICPGFSRREYEEIFTAGLLWTAF
jgi:hypothetical protein